MDAINPAHYQGEIEAIDAMRVVLGPLGIIDYCQGSVLKYAWRAGKKDSAAQDFRKAAWYAERAARYADELAE